MVNQETVNAVNRLIRGLREIQRASASVASSPMPVSAVNEPDLADVSVGEEEPGVDTLMAIAEQYGGGFEVPDAPSPTAPEMPEPVSMDVTAPEESQIPEQDTPATQETPAQEVPPMDVTEDESQVPEVDVLEPQQEEVAEPEDPLAEPDDE